MSFTLMGTAKMYIEYLNFIAMCTFVYLKNSNITADVFKILSPLF